MKTIVNRIPNSKVIKVICEDKNKRFLQKQTLKSKMNLFAVEWKKDKISRQMDKLNTIAEQISLRDKLVNAGTVESFLLSASSYKNTAGKGDLEKKCHHKKQIRQNKQETKS